MLLLLPAMGCFHELPLIGDLAGQWQITKIEYPDGRVVENPLTYYCFYRHTAQLTKYDRVKHTANMVYNYPEISLEFPEVSPVWLTEWGIIPPADADSEYRGWVQNYHIDRLNSSYLVMTTEQGVKLTLRKF
ncbi:MAG: lipocalin-like domain-containing protein [Firmicutes bacterium]|nr:lipocalin-like domain-containing protein [Bacillota bacterium]MCM1401523.1 lipocalin-like domain-containing protein [Bacteroides sp.]MCM1477373.1 lipocalin-like domain-containing protein [Bacteroides sp.]